MAKQPEGWSNEDAIIPTRKLGSVAQSKQAILSQIEPLSNKKPKFKGGIYGMPGTGKTVTALRIAQELATEEKPGIVYIDTAENWSSALNHPELKKNVLRFQYTTWDDILLIAEMIYKGEGPMAKVGALIIDEYNSYAEYDVRWITSQRSKHAEMDNKPFRDPYFPQLPDYLTGVIRSDLLLDGLMKLDINLICVAHAAKDKDTRWMAPDMGAKTRQGFTRKLHVLAYAEVNEKADGKRAYTLRLSPLASQKIEAKGRIGNLGDVVTVDQLINAYKNWGNKPDAPIEEVKVKKVATATEEAIDTNQLLSTI